MLKEVGGILGRFEKTWFGKQVDTFVDKLNRIITVLLLLALSILVSAKQYVGSPIHCRQQSTDDENLEKYMNQVCWVTNTYYVPKGEVLTGQDLSEYKRINYYQWVPMVLLVQAFMFYLPNVFWQGMLQQSGLDLTGMVSAGIQVHAAVNTEEREKKLEVMAGQLGGYLTHYHNTDSTCLAKCSARVLGFFNRLLCGKRTGSYLVLVYMATKSLYVANSVGQFYILNRFLSSDIHAYGWAALMSIISGNQWPESEIFPKSTMCRFDLHALGSQIHRHVVQCVLPVNFFHDKLYIAVWFWLVILASANCLSFLLWLARFLFSIDRISFVNHHLRALGKIVKGKEKPSAHFILDFLKQDGVFVLRLIKLNVSGLVCAQVTAALWDRYNANRTPQSFQRQPSTKGEELECQKLLDEV